ncbi:MAG: diguanylate cyclase domain-containing protein [Bacillota bacterium]
MESAFVCDRKLFSYIYELESRRADRDWASTFISLIKIKAERASEPKVKEADSHLMDILKSKLRNGDVICQLDDDQYAIILYDINSKDTASVMARISNNFSNNNSKSVNELEIDYKRLA